MINSIFEGIRSGVTLTQFPRRFVRFNRCKANSSPSVRWRVGLEFAPDENLCEWVCPNTVGDTQSTALAHSKTGSSWGRRQGETTLNGSTMTSHTLPEEKKSWVRKLFYMASVTNRLRCLCDWLDLGLRWKFVLYVVFFLPPDLSLFMKW